MADLPLRQVLAVGVGNALEFYDFLTFSFFALQIGHSFFPEAGATHGLLYSLATFGVGFLTRPLGGIVIGRYGDRAGRKPAMLLSFALMGVALLGMALTPSYARIGAVAPILLVVFRLLQGFALGGEVGPSTAFLVEAAPADRRGLFVSLQFASQNSAVLAAGLVGFVLASLMSPEALADWGWRVAFLIGVAIVPVGLVIRRRLPETLDAAAPDPVGKRLTVRTIVLAILILGSATIGAYVLNYLSTYAQNSLNLPANLAFGATIVSGLCGACASPVSGLLSDRVGRKPVMLASIATLIVLVVPCFVVMQHLRSAAALYGAAAVLGLLQAFYAGPALVLITEGLPRAVRSGALATLYALAIATFGGSTQYVVTRLIDATGNPLAPAWYLAGALIIGATAMAVARETAPIRAAWPAARR